jgi:hypothetical protein
MVVLPNPANVNSMNILQPRVSQSTMIQIKEFLNVIASPFVNIEVISPDYEALQITCDVKLKKEYSDESFYRKQLQTDLTGFLAPWSIQNGTVGSFGYRLYKSQIIDFIEERPYIDYITNIEVYANLGEFNIKFNDLIYGRNEYTILTSVSAENHLISTEAIC